MARARRSTGPKLPRGPDVIRLENIHPGQWIVEVRSPLEKVRVGCVNETAARNFAGHAQRVGVWIEHRFVSDPECQVIPPEPSHAAPRP